MGFVTELTTYSQPHRGHPYPLFTVVGRRDLSSVATTLQRVDD